MAVNGTEAPDSGPIQNNDQPQPQPEPNSNFAPKRKLSETDDSLDWEIGRLTKNLGEL